MALNDPTTVYGFDLPADGGATDTWGTETNEAIADVQGAIDSVDEVIAALRVALGTVEGSVSTDEGRVGVISGQNKPAYARAISSAAATITKDTATILSWTSAPLNVQTLWASGAPTRLTVPEDYDGLYDVRAVVEVQRYAGSGDNARRWEIRLLKNGAEIASAQVPYLNDGSESTGNQMIMVEALIQGGPGDYFEVQVYWNEFEEDATTALANVSSSPFKTFFSASRFPSPITSALWEPFTSYIPIGMYGSTPWAGQEPATTAQFGDGKGRYFPFIPSEDMTIDKLAMRVNAHATNEGTARMGIYSIISDTDHRPGALVAETGDFTTTASDVLFDEDLASAAVLSKGTIYWFAMIWKKTSGAVLEYYAAQNANSWPSLGQSAFGNANEIGNIGILSTVGTSWSAMPDPADLTSESIGAEVPVILAHRSA